MQQNDAVQIKQITQLRLKKSTFRNTLPTFKLDFYDEKKRSKTYDFPNLRLIFILHSVFQMQQEVLGARKWHFCNGDKSQVSL